MVGLSLVLSEYLAPLVWSSLTLILDPWNYRRGARSLLHDLERGEPGPVTRVLLAGLACGVVWESLNFFAPQKWVYTVRGLEGLKLFEMPLPGFLGFPALGLDAFAAYACVSYWFHGNATWEHPADCGQRLAPRRALSARAFAGTLPLHLALWGAMMVLVQNVNIGSVRVDLDNLDGLGPAEVERLNRQGIRRPRQLLAAGRDVDRRREIRSAVGLSEGELDRIVDEAHLYTLKGIGHHHGAVLRRLGIQRVEDLARADPDELYHEMVRLRGRATFPALRVEMVRVWIAAAQDEGHASP
jgi:predicted flap endonuclease-1-like 5' DNA nuclease